jgi:hypothetical protein
LSSKLRSLVKADPVLMEYALAHLGEGVPPNPTNPFYFTNIQNLRLEILEILSAREWHEAITTKQLDKLEQQWTEHLFQEASLRRFLREIRDEDADRLRQRMRDLRTVVRLVAVQAAAARRLHLEADLIERLDDPSKGVAQAARQTLVLLARGTDFGPPPRAGKVARTRAVARWKDWFALQRLAAADPSADPRPAPVDFQTAVNNVLGKSVHVLVAEDPDIVRLRDELIQARGDAQAEVLQRLKEAKGVLHTEALAQAIPRLPDAVQDQARDALAERLTRMKAKTLRDKFGEDDAEVRRAAALACARKGATEHIPDLFALLDDPEPAVVQAAHTALTQLTRQDFGPAADAGPAERAKARAAWRDWWEKQGATAAAGPADKAAH